MRVANKLTPETKSKTTETKPEYKSEQFQDKTLQLLVPNSKRLGGYTQIDPRSATRFRTGKYSDDACSCSARPEGTRRSFQNSTIKYSGTYQSQDHRPQVFSVLTRAKRLSRQKSTHPELLHGVDGSQTSTWQIKKICQGNGLHTPSGLHNVDESQNE